MAHGAGPHPLLALPGGDPAVAVLKRDDMHLMAAAGLVARDVHLHNLHDGLQRFGPLVGGQGKVCGIPMSHRVCHHLCQQGEPVWIFVKGAIDAPDRMTMQRQQL